MFQAVVRTASQLLQDLQRSLRRQRGSGHQTSAASSPSPPKYWPLERLLLTDSVSRTLFEEYATHRAELRGEEETGWVLLGLRGPREALVLATLPAGALRDASTAHVLFNSAAQALGSRIVRQADRRLAMIGVVHTHPGSLRHPTDGDYRGDSQWVKSLCERKALRGGEGIFGIGTADGELTADPTVAHQPRPHVQCLGELRFSWYALGQDDAGYRPVPVELTLGPDLARPLHDVWEVIEIHADRLDRLYRQQAGVIFQVVSGSRGPRLAVNVSVAEPDTVVRVLLDEKEVRYYLDRGGEWLAAGFSEDRVDRGVYLLLADLAAQQ